jgi:hypothetical protein
MRMAAFRNPVPMCDCPTPLVVAWRVEGRWVTVRVLMGLPSDITRMGREDDEQWASSGADAWAVGCPTCRTVYVGGIRVVTP